MNGMSNSYADRSTDFMKTDEARVGAQNAKTKRQTDCMALSSGGQLLLKQTRQMRHETTSKHELIMTEAPPQKNFEMKLTKWNIPGMLVRP